MDSRCVSRLAAVHGACLVRAPCGPSRLADGLEELLSATARKLRCNLCGLLMTLLGETVGWQPLKQAGEDRICASVTILKSFKGLTHDGMRDKISKDACISCFDRGLFLRCVATLTPSPGWEAGLTESDSPTVQDRISTGQELITLARLVCFGKLVWQHHSMIDTCQP